MAPFSKNIDFNLTRDHQENFLWVGRRKEPILGYHFGEVKNFNQMNILKPSNFYYVAKPLDL